MMRLAEFEKGRTFVTDTGTWLCTDKGSRVIVAIREAEDRSLMNGPPYAVAETVFDEHDMEGCRLE